MVRPPLDVVVVDDGMLAMTADRMSVGDTPSVVAEVQPARESTETAAIAPARACEGVTMSGGKASSTPECSAVSSGCSARVYDFVIPQWSPSGVRYWRQTPAEIVDGRDAGL